MLVEYLTGEEGGVKEQISAAHISRLIIAGNSLAVTHLLDAANPERCRAKRKSCELFCMHTVNIMSST
jgi:DNA polymerase delta subunit 2